MKKLLLNCDQVFDVLTRGPFPTGEPEDVAVEQHLRACHDCRQLAEALRPAISLLHEAVAADEAIDLPEYQGSLPWKRPRQQRRLTISRLAGKRAARASEDSAPRPQSLSGGQPRQPRIISAVRFIAAGLLIASLGLLFGGTVLSSKSKRLVAQAAPPDVPVIPASALPADGAPGELGLLTLASLKLPAACIPLTHQPLSAEHAVQIATALADGSLISLHCCTECHHAGRERADAPIQIASIIQQNCQACHRG